MLIDFKNICSKLFFLLLLSLCLGTININIGFAIKPYMIITVFIIMCLLLTKTKSILNLSLGEFYLIIFALYCMVCAIFFVEKVTILRYVFGLLIMLLTCTFSKKILINLNRQKILDIIVSVGFVFSIITLVYYLFGLISLNFNFYGNRIISYGVLIDRGSARLISLASSDPNITAFIFTIFCFISLLDLKKVRNKFVFITSLLIVIFTFSRGAYVSFAIGFLVYLYLKKSVIKRNLFKIIISLFAIIGLVLIGNNITNGEILNTILLRFQGTSSDGGSGRISLWINALNIFYKYPIFGIGINNTLSYNLSHGFSTVYTHNTYLQILSETGIIGFLLYSVFFYQLLKKSLNIYKMNNKYFAFVCITICYFVQMLFLSLVIQEMFFVYYAIVCVFEYLTKNKDRSDYSANQ